MVLIYWESSWVCADLCTHCVCSQIQRCLNVNALICRFIRVHVLRLFLYAYSTASFHHQAFDYRQAHAANQEPMRTYSLFFPGSQQWHQIRRVATRPRPSRKKAQSQFVPRNAESWNRPKEYRPAPSSNNCLDSSFTYESAHCSITWNECRFVFWEPWPPNAVRTTG